MKKIPLLVAVAIAVALAGCASKDTTPPLRADGTLSNPSQPMTQAPLNFEVTGYANGTPIPAPFATKAGGGENVSIGLKWQPLPAAQSYALLFDDRAPIARNWMHWLVVDIPNTVTEIPEGASRTDRMPNGSRELATSWGRTGYDGPQPPVGSGNHEYAATLYALDVSTLSVPENPSRREFLNALEGHAIAQESWSGTYERK